MGVIFVLGFAASAFAIHAEIPSETQAVVAKGQTQITLGGELRFRGETRQNTNDFNNEILSTVNQGGRTQEGTFLDGRVRLSVDAQLSPNTEGFVQVEAGNGNIADTWTWGPNDTGAKGLYRAGNVKQGSFNLLQAWIQYKGSDLLGFPIGVKVGHMPLALGNYLFFDHTKFGDDAILVFSNPLKELEVDVLGIKFREGNIALSDDATAYVGIFAYNTKEFGISGDVTYVDDQPGTGAGVGPTVGPPPTLGNPVHFWNFGLRGNTNIAGLGIKVDGEVQAGKVDNADVDFRGWAVMAGLDYKLEPVKLTFDFAYGSGDDGDDPGKIKSFVTSLGTDQHFTYVYEYSTVNACGQASGGLCNTWYLKVGGEADITKELNAKLNLYYLRAVEEVAGGSSKYIGTEADWKVTYKLDRNLNYYIEGGYLFAGNFWKSLTGGREPDDAYAIRNGIILSF